MTRSLLNRLRAHRMAFCVVALACAPSGSRLTVVRPLMAPGAASCVANALRRDSTISAASWRDATGLTWDGGVRPPAANADTGRVVATFKWSGTRSDATVADARAQLQSRLSVLSKRCRLPQAVSSCEYKVEGRRRPCTTTLATTGR